MELEQSRMLAHNEHFYLTYWQVLLSHVGTGHLWIQSRTNYYWTTIHVFFIWNYQSFPVFSFCILICISSRLPNIYICKIINPNQIVNGAFTISQIHLFQKTCCSSTSKWQLNSNYKHKVLTFREFSLQNEKKDKIEI